MNNDVNNGKSLASVLTDMKRELQEFVSTRLAMLRTELREKLTTLKVAIPLALVGLVMLGTAYLLFTLALVGLVLAFLPDTPYRWCFAFLSIAVLWTIVGGIAAYFAKRELEVKGLMPQKTISVLKGDKIWIESEVKG